jgi:hypothetical protein
VEVRLVLAIAVVLGLAPAAHAARWERVGSSVAGVATDGARYAVWARDRHTVIVDGRARLTVGVRPVCGYVMAIVAGSGKAALLCNGNGYTEARRVVVMDLATGAHRRVPELVLGAETMQTVTAVGRRWLTVEGASGTSAWRFWVNARTGRKATVRGRRRHPDLDAPVLGRPLCAPLQRPLAVPFEGLATWPRLGDVAHTGGWLVFRRTAAGGSDLVAWRCGAPVPRVLAHCPCSDVQAAGGVVTWRRHRRVHVVRLAGLRRTSARLPGRVTAVRHTRRWLYRASARRVYRAATASTSRSASVSSL